MCVKRCTLSGQRLGERDPPHAGAFNELTWQVMSRGGVTKKRDTATPIGGESTPDTQGVCFWAFLKNSRSFPAITAFIKIGSDLFDSRFYVAIPTLGLFKLAVFHCFSLVGAWNLATSHLKFRLFFRPIFNLSFGDLIRFFVMFQMIFPLKSRYSKKWQRCNSGAPFNVSSCLRGRQMGNVASFRVFFHSTSFAWAFEI